MDQDKRDHSDRKKEMNGAGGLLSAEGGGQPRKDRSDGGRHSQACPDEQGKQNENDDEIGKPLHHVVAMCIFSWRAAEARGASDTSAAAGRTARSGSWTDSAIAMATDVSTEAYGGQRIGQSNRVGWPNYQGSKQS